MWSDIFASLSLPTLAVLWGGALLGGIASGAAGFAFGIAASAIWLHALAPIHATFLVVAGGLIDPVRHDLAVAPFARPPAALAVADRPACSACRSASGCWCAPTSRTLKIALGAFSPSTASMRCSRRGCRTSRPARGADTAIGFVGGVLGGLGGYSGVLPAIWSQLRGWPKDEARDVLPAVHRDRPCRRPSPLLGTVALDRTGLVLFVLALPALALGAWVGWNSTAGSTSGASGRCSRCC